MWGYEGQTLELTYNYGTEKDPNFHYNNGNVEPYRGFGHIAFMVCVFAGVDACWNPCAWGAW